MRSHQLSMFYEMDTWYIQLHGLNDQLEHLEFRTGSKSQLDEFRKFAPTLAYQAIGTLGNVESPNPLWDSSLGNPDAKWYTQHSTRSDNGICWEQWQFSESWFSHTETIQATSTPALHVPAECTCATRLEMLMLSQQSDWPGAIRLEAARP
jgi:hypothetical protein